MNTTILPYLFLIAFSLSTNTQPQNLTIDQYVIQLALNNQCGYLVQESPEYESVFYSQNIDQIFAPPSPDQIIHFAILLEKTLETETSADPTLLFNVKKQSLSPFLNWIKQLIQKTQLITKSYKESQLLLPPMEKHEEWGITNSRNFLRSTLLSFSQVASLLEKIYTLCAHKLLYQSTVERFS